MNGGVCDVCGHTVDALHRRYGNVDHVGDMVCGDCLIEGSDWVEWPDDVPNWNGGQS